MSYSQGSSKQRTEMGSIGTAVTGAAFINDWSDRNGKVPMSFEVHCPNNPLDTLTLSLAPRDISPGLWVPWPWPLGGQKSLDGPARGLFGRSDMSSLELLSYFWSLNTIWVVQI